jgi:DNA-binding NarL/FixJ family response regulator
MKSIAILTADLSNGRYLREHLQIFRTLQVRLVHDEPDFSIRPLGKADIVIFDRGVPRERAKKILRALRMISIKPRCLLIMPLGDDGERMFEYLGLGAQAIVREAASVVELVEAVPRVASGRLYVSPDLVPMVLERYRELCAEWHRFANGKRNVTETYLRG